MIQKDTISKNTNGDLRVGYNKDKIQIQRVCSNILNILNIKYKYKFSFHYLSIIIRITLNIYIYFNKHQQSVPNGTHLKLWCQCHKIHCYWIGKREQKGVFNYVRLLSFIDYFLITVLYTTESNDKTNMDAYIKTRESSGDYTSFENNYHMFSYKTKPPPN